MTNVFLVSPRLGPEDRLTAHWHYVLDAVPGLGQAFVDHLARRASLQQSPFLGTIDHPQGDAANRPDFLIRCRDYTIICEHKLDSPLGAQQLQRYLAIAQRNASYLALVAGRRLDIDKAVQRSPRYLKPREASSPDHFLWQDVHGLVSSSRSRIARDFSEYLEALGLMNADWGERGDPFTNEGAAEEFRSLYDCVKPLFRGPGVSCMKSWHSLVYQVRKPFRGIHLLNLLPIQSVAEWDSRLWGRVFALHVFTKRALGSKRYVLSPAHGYIRDSEPRVYVNDLVWGPYRYDPQVFMERQYYVPLNDVLIRSKKGTEARLLNFVESVLAHLQGKRALVPT